MMVLNNWVLWQIILFKINQVFDLYQNKNELSWTVRGFEWSITTLSVICYIVAKYNANIWMIILFQEIKIHFVAIWFSVKLSCISILIFIDCYLVRSLFFDSGPLFLLSSNGSTFSSTSILYSISYSVMISSHVLLHLHCN